MVTGVPLAAASSYVRLLGTTTLAAWLITAGIGGFMLRSWIARGGLSRQRATGVGVPPLLVFGHPSAAVTGLVVWICYLATWWAPLAWLGVGIISAAITLGICMVTLWTPYPIRDKPPESRPESPAPAGSPGEITDEMIAMLLTGSFPARKRPALQLAPLVPLCHGFAALATFMLATLTAAGAL
jgi:hypothetical protein